MYTLVVEVVALVVMAAPVVDLWSFTYVKAAVPQYRNTPLQVKALHWIAEVLAAKCT